MHSCTIHYDFIYTVSSKRTYSSGEQLLGLQSLKISWLFSSITVIIANNMIIMMMITVISLKSFQENQGKGQICEINETKVKRTVHEPVHVFYGPKFYILKVLKR